MSSSGRCVHANEKCQISNIVHAQGISWLLQKSGLFSLLMPQRANIGSTVLCFTPPTSETRKPFRRCFRNSAVPTECVYTDIDASSRPEILSIVIGWPTSHVGRSDNTWFSLLVCRLCPLFGKHIDQSDDVHEGYRNVAYNWMRQNDIHNTQSRNKATQTTECTSLIS